MKTVRKALCLLISLVFVLGGMPRVSGQTDMFGAEESYNEIQILKGDIETIRTNNLKRVSITDPVIADINDARAKAVEVIGLESGQTVLFIWDDMGKRTVVIRVVDEDLGLVRRRVQSLLESAGITGLKITENDYEGKVVVSGPIAEQKQEALKNMLEPFRDRVINLTEKERIDDLIQIDMQITELGTSLKKEMGVDWNNRLLYQENLPGTSISHSNLEDIFKVGSFVRTPQLVALVSALIEEGKAKILSRPRIVVLSGKEASFLVGGEVPIKSTTTSGDLNTQTENTEYKEYGVNLSLTPTIEKNNKINILLNVEVSEIDASESQGDDYAFLTRNAQTQLLMDNKQTIVLAGMIKQRNSELKSQVPFLGSVPLVGALFRSKKTPAANTESELVISITPTILSEQKDKSRDRKAAQEKPLVTEEIVTPPEPRVPNPVISKVVEPAPAPVVSAPGEGAQGYASSVQQKILSAIAYPYEAQEKGWEGTVKLTLVLERDGTLQNVVVKDSSGYELFDQDAINTAQILAPYAAFPPEVEADDMTVTIPIVYSLDGFLKNVAAQ